jgi:hypothetical protein
MCENADVTVPIRPNPGPQNPFERVEMDRSPPPEPRTGAFDGFGESFRRNLRSSLFSPGGGSDRIDHLPVPRTILRVIYRVQVPD